MVCCQPSWLVWLKTKALRPRDVHYLFLPSLPTTCCVPLSSTSSRTDWRARWSRPSRTPGLPGEAGGGSRPTSLLLGPARQTDLAQTSLPPGCPRRQSDISRTFHHCPHYSSPQTQGWEVTSVTINTVEVEDSPCWKFHLLLIRERRGWKFDCDGRQV